MGVIILLAGVAVWCYVAYRGYQHGVLECKVLFADCDASEALTNWRIANPDLHIGDVPHARQLVLNRIVAYERLCKVCLFVKKDKDFIAFFVFSFG